MAGIDRLFMGHLANGSPLTFRDFDTFLEVVAAWLRDESVLFETDNDRASALLEQLREAGLNVVPYPDPIGEPT